MNKLEEITDQDSTIHLDRGTRLPIYSPVCTFCARWIVGPDQKCEAFPEGIPEEIWTGENDHTSPFPGDGGLQFLKAK
jgi:hypothetical protein